MNAFSDGTVQDIFIYGFVLLGAILCVIIGLIVSNAGLPPMNKQGLEADRQKWVEDFYKQQAEIERLAALVVEARVLLSCALPNGRLISDIEDWKNRQLRWLLDCYPPEIGMAPQ